MNTKKFWLAFVATYVVYQVFGFLTHQVWLLPVYQEIAEVFRPKEQMDSMAWIFFVTSAIVVWVFCFVFTRGYEGRGVGEGVRYGLLMGLFLMVIQAWDSFVIYPLPYHLILKWFVSGMVMFIVMGITVAMIYKPADQ